MCSCACGCGGFGRKCGGWGWVVEMWGMGVEMWGLGVQGGWACPLHIVHGVDSSGIQCTCTWNVHRTTACHHQRCLHQRTPCPGGSAANAAANVLSSCSVHSSSFPAASTCTSPELDAVNTLHALTKATRAVRIGRLTDQSGRGTSPWALLMWGPSRDWYRCSCWRAARRAVCTAVLCSCTVS